jgi:CheY-like chemotaxis protein
VLLNLLTNAARFTERGWIEVRLVSREHDIRVTVRDTGPGVAPNDLSHIFEQFVSGDRPRPGWRAGTGLGLPISKQFVELHGGEMGVESRVGVGTTFWFTLPLVPVEAGTTLTVPAGVSSAYLRPADQVLVLAQPDVKLAHLLQRHLEGYRIEVARDLAEAQIKAREFRASAVVADLDAPEVAVSPGLTPVLRCPLPHIRRFARWLGVQDYLVKPVSREDLLRAIRGPGSPIARVLVVDDDTRFVRLLVRMLGSDGGYLISTAHNGQDALVKLRAEHPDLLLLDLSMPVLDGIGVLAELRADPALRDTRVIVISAHGEGEGMLPLGTEVRISKPEGFRLGELTRVVGAAASQLAPVRAHLDGMEPVPSGAQPG